MWIHIVRNITRITKNNKNVLFYIVINCSLALYESGGDDKRTVISPWRKLEWQLIKDRVNVK